jgi:Uncharacterized conserved protein (DUF2190)
MSQESQSGIKAFTCAADMVPYRRVKLDGSGNVVYAGANEPAIGIVQPGDSMTNGSIVSVRLMNDRGTFKMMAGAAITQFAVVYGLANGKIDDTAGSSDTGSPIGVALESATADGDIIEVLPLPSAQGVRFVMGQHTTAAAVDTIVTGLALVFGAVAGLDSDPSDNPEWVNASIGDQAGTPAAGSILIKSWQNTGGTDPTPAAAGTFSKKVNWVAWGK